MVRYLADVVRLPRMVETLASGYGLVEGLGQQAPDFTLPYSRTESATLSDYRGKKKVMLAFYVLDFTGG